MIRLRAAPQPGAPDAVRYFTKPDGTELKAGDVLKNPAYAATLQLLAAEGPNAILTGRIADDIVQRLLGRPAAGHDDAGRPRRLSAAREPRRSAGPTASTWSARRQAPSGGPALLEELGLLEHTDIATRGPADAQGWLEIAEAERLMYADRDKYEGDPKFVSYPLEGLLDPGYLAERAKLIGDDGRPAADARPPGRRAVAYGPDAHRRARRHLALRDRRRRGQRRLDDHHGGEHLRRRPHGRRLLPQQPADRLLVRAQGPRRRAGRQRGRPPASGRARRWRPIIVLDSHGDFVAAVGSPGGNAIPAYVLKAIVGFSTGSCRCSRRSTCRT